MSGFHGAFATGVACQQGTLTLPDTWFRPPFWDLLMLQLLRPNSSNLPCLYSTFHLEYPLVLSRFCCLQMIFICVRLNWLDIHECHTMPLKTKIAYRILTSFTKLYMRQCCNDWYHHAVGGMKESILVSRSGFASREYCKSLKKL